jgi:2,4-dienoyl-CoA reductase-like NADH-dependent reductase (Old Yellow Enzyme family)
MVKAGLSSIEVSAGIGSAIARLREGEVSKIVFRERAAAVKKAVNVPVAVVNGVRNITVAEDIIDSGDADMISMSRPFIREPHLVTLAERRDISGQMHLLRQMHAHRRQERVAGMRRRKTAAGRSTQVEEVIYADCN